MKRLYYLVSLLVVFCVISLFPIYATEQIAILYKCNNTNTTTNSIRAHFQIMNSGTTSIAYSRIKIRYWYTRDTVQNQTFTCDWAAIGSNKVIGGFSVMETPVTNADCYLEISFPTTAGNLAAGANSGDIQTRFNKNDWSDYAQTNDYSFDSSYTTFGQNTRITGYIDGVLAFGTEPDSSPLGAPANLTLQLQSSRSAYLTWSPSTSQGVAGYKVYRNGVQVGDTAQTALAVSGLSANTAYTFTVKAYNSANNLSADSNAVAMTTDPATTNGFMVIVANPLYQIGQLATALNTYRADLANEGWTVKQIRINNVSDSTANWICPNPPALKVLLSDFYNAGYKGMVLIGSGPAIPTAYWCNNINDKWQMPTDLFYGDLAPWTDSNGDGVYEAGTPGNEASLISAPELFYARISAGGVVNTLPEEATMAASYLNKVHNYRVGRSNLTLEEQNRGLVFSDDDWYRKDCSRDGRTYGYVEYCNKPAIPNMHVIYDRFTTNRSKLESELSAGYLYSQIVTHGSPNFIQVNQWKDGTLVSDTGFNLSRLSLLAPNTPRVHYIHSYGCNTCQFADSSGPIPNMGASYLLNNDYTLNVTGVAASCSVALDRDYFNDFASGIIGLAHRNYVTRKLTDHDSEQGAMPAFMLLGDPTLRYRITQLSNTAPQISNNLSCLEAAVGTPFTLPLTIFDPENDPVTVTVSGLPAGATFNSGTNTITWTPSAGHVGNSYPMTVTVSDSYGHSFTEDFTVYVSYFRNGLLNSTAGWTALEGTVGSPVTNWSPFLDSVSEFATTISRTAISQNISVQNNTDYSLVFWCRNNLTLGDALLRVDQLGQEVICPTSADYYNYYALRFNSGANTTLTVSLLAGNGTEVSSGKVYFTGLRLFPSHYDNLGFEEVYNGFPVDWTGEVRSGNRLALTSESNPANVRSGNYAARIDGPVMNASIFHNQHLIVRPHTNYRFTGYIRTNNVVADNPAGRGAYFYLSHAGGVEYSVGVLGTNGWQLQTIDFNSGDSSFISLECHLGGWPGLGELATGTAWFDDLSLTELP